jgi:hypothetical protein
LQTGFSGRAELGTIGDDDFHFKVSGNGTTWSEALTINRNTGVVSLPQGLGALPLFGASEKGLVPPSGGGAATFLRADGAWSAPSGGGSGSLVFPYKTASGRWHVNATNTTTLTTSGGIANRFDLAPWVCQSEFIIDQLGLLCSTGVAASLAKIVCYNSDSHGRPDALLFETAALDLGTIGFKSIAQAYSFNSGECYWFGLRTSSSAVVNAHQPYCSPVLGFPPTPTSSAPKLLRRSFAFASAATATWGYNGAEETIGNVPAIFLRVV